MVVFSYKKRNRKFLEAKVLGEFGAQKTITTPSQGGGNVDFCPGSTYMQQFYCIGGFANPISLYTIVNLLSENILAETTICND
jgi:hypothetical protein